MEKILSVYSTGIFICKINGEVTIDDLGEHAVKNMTSVQKAPVLWDFTDADFSKISIDAWEGFVKKLKPFIKRRAGARTALVGDDDQLYRMLKIFKAWAKIEKYPIEYNTFREIDKAKDWLLSDA